MSNITDTTTVELFVNGEQAEQAMTRLREKADELGKAIEDAKSKGDLKEAAKLQRELDKVNKELNRTESAAKGAGVVLNDLSNTSIHGLKNALRYLEKQIRMTKPNTEQWREYAEQIQTVRGRIAELNAELEGGQSLWGGFKDWADDTWPAIDLLSRGYDAAINTMREYVDAYASMDQEMANVRKFTGMTEEQVADLNEEFKKMDTRTSREGLNKLAQEAGRLGKTSKEDLLGYVSAADKINVALDDIGEGATLSLSKLTGVFGIEDQYGTEQSLLKVGSVINELSQNCSASAPYLAQFASRMGGVGAQAKMTIPQIMAFGAVLDSNGQAVEASSTALQQVIVHMMQEPAKYAKAAGLDVKKFSDMLRTDVNGALIMFLETLQSVGGMDVLSPMFKDMGENGQRAISTLSTLATHIDEVKAQQREANKAFREGTSIDNEFAVQNTTVQASLEKAKKAANELRVELGQQLAPLMSHLISSTAAMTRALVTLISFVMDNKVAVISLTAGIAAYSVAVNAAIIKSKLWAAATTVGNALLVAQRLILITLSGATALLTGNITRATAAFRLFSTAIKANPIGLAISLITTAIAALSSWAYKVREARKAEEELARERAQKAKEFRDQISDISQSASDYAKGELDRLKKLYDATQDQTKSQKERIAAVRELQKTYPAAFGNLSKEAILAGNASSAYQNLANSIIKAAKAKAAAEKIKDNEKLILELEMERDDLNESIIQDSEALDAALSKRRSTVRKVSADNMLSFTGPSKKERAQLSSTKNEVIRLEESIDSNSERLENVHIQLDELNRANERLAKKAADPSKIAPDIDFSSPTLSAPSGTLASAPSGSGKRSGRVESEADRKKREAKERRETEKNKQTFIDQLEEYKSMKVEADREVFELYKSGSIDYATLVQRRHENEKSYYESSLQFFEDVFADQKETYLKDDKDYQKLLLDKEKADEKYEKTRVSLALESIERRKTMEEKDVQHEYDMKSGPTIEDEIELQAKLYSIRRQALDDKLALYKEGSKEYEDIQIQLSVLEHDRELAQEKLFCESVNKLHEQYDEKSAAEKYKLEKAALDALLKANILTAEQYARYLKALTEKYRQELPGGNEESAVKSAQKKYDADAAALRDALETRILTQEDFNRRMAGIENDRQKNMLDGLKMTGGEWNSMLVDIYTSFHALVSGFDESLTNTLSNISNCVATVSSAVTAGMQIASQFAEAESTVRIKAVEKRYDREIEMAQGNSYKVTKLEKKKEEETAKIKNAASKKQYQMQVIQAVAQALTAGLNAYTSTLAIPVIGPTLAPAAMAVALAMGSAQVLLLKKQQQAAQAQGYSKGGFTRKGGVDEPAGIVHAGEWVASQKLLASPVARPMIEALDYAQRTNTIGRLRPDDVSRSITAGNSLVRIAESDNGSAVMVAAALKLAASADSMTSRLSEPFVTVATVTGDKGIKQAQDDYTNLINNVTPKSKRKK